MQVLSPEITAIYSIA